MAHRAKTILFIPTMRCNLKCSVCHFKLDYFQNGSYDFMAYGKNHSIDKEIDLSQWQSFLKRSEPYHLEITGGEPLLYKGLPDLINAISEPSTWAITSNTLLDISTIDLSRCFHWTASYHGVEKERFIENLERLKGRVVSSVSIVAEFAHVDKWICEAASFKGLGYKVNILRELNPGVNWTGTKEWQRLVLLRREGFNISADDIPPNYVFNRGYECRAGADYMCAMPDGKVYRCYSEAMLESPIGDINIVGFDQGTHNCFSKCLACAGDFKYRGRKLNDGETGRV